MVKLTFEISDPKAGIRNFNSKWRRKFMIIMFFQKTKTFALELSFTTGLVQNRCQRSENGSFEDFVFYMNSTSIFKYLNIT